MQGNLPFGDPVQIKLRENLEFRIFYFGEKQLFRRFLSEDVHETIVQSKIDFMKNYSFFSGWNTSKMLSLWELLRLSRFPKNSVIFKEGDEAKSLFFVKSGEIEVRFLYFIAFVIIDVSLILIRFRNFSILMKNREIWTLIFQRRTKCVHLTR